MAPRRRKSGGHRQQHGMHTKGIHLFRCSVPCGGAPEQGRSALDAAELMNIGVQFLREHIGKNASVHYAFTDAGGVSPNVVQSKAKVLYMIREATVQDAVKLEARVDKIAQGAALMTETQLSTRFIDGTANPLPLKTMEQLLYKNFVQVALPEYTEEEWAYAAALKNTYESAGLARLCRQVR